MTQGPLHGQLIGEIFAKILDGLQDSRAQVHDIVETSRTEYNHIQLTIEDLRQEITKTIRQVDQLEIDFQRVRQRLVEVSRNYQAYHENERRTVYEQADNIREKLTIAREREKYLRQRRTEQERALVRIAGLVDKAESLISQVGVVLDFLQGNISQVSSHLEGMNLRYQFGQKVIKAQEDERKRVAREIHDGPAQNLANVVLKAEICEKMYQAGHVDELLVELAELKTCVKNSLQEVRKIIYNLRPMALDDLGLVPAVKRYMEDFEEHTGIRLSFMVFGKDVRLDTTIELAVFRIVQEALNNCRKYAEAEDVKVKIEFLADHLNASIEDNGIGFSLKEVEERSLNGEHFGLFGMRERMDLLAGSFNVNSSPGKGTRISIKIPLEAPDGGKHHGK